MIESVTSCFTPTFFFCLLNLMIATIFITSNLKSDKKINQQNSVPHLSRSPSLLQRVKSFDFSFPHPFNSSESDQTPSILQRAMSIKLSFNRVEVPGPLDSVARHPGPYEEQAQQGEVGSVESDVSISKSFEDAESHVTRSKSVTCLEAATKMPSRTIVKSASEKKMAAATEELVDRRWPATTRETKSFSEDGAVDKKADDFINKFRQQLKLQRIDSIVRYNEMLNRGVGK